MKPRKLGRSEKYYPLPRSLYALKFPNERAVYVGQSKDHQERFKQHARGSGGWNRTFEPILLSEMVGTFADAESHEKAWRLVLQREGWRIYGKPPGIIVRPERLATAGVRYIAMSLKTPDALKLKRLRIPYTQIFLWMFGLVVALKVLQIILFMTLFKP